MIGRIVVPTALVVLGGAATLSAQSIARVATDSFTAPVEVPSQGVVMRGNIHVAAGRGPHTTVVFLQGFPGQEDPAFPAYVQAAGFNGMGVSFRGQHASDGLYSIDGTVDDATAMVAFLRSDSARRAYRVDPQRIVLVAASAGTLAALQATSRDPSLRCVATMVPFNWAPAGVAARSDPGMRARFDQLMRSLTAGPRAPIRESGFVERLLANANDYDLARAGSALRGRAVFLAGAEHDQTAPLQYHFTPLAQAVRSATGARLRDTVVTDGHTLLRTYQPVFAAIVDWLRTDCLRKT